MVIFANSQDPVTNDFNSFLLNYGIWLALGVAVAVIIVFIIMFLLGNKKKKGKVAAKTFETNEVFEALGGKENVLTHSKNGSRISLTLSDYDKVNEKMLNALGVDSIIKMSNKITLVIKDDADSFYKLFN